MELEKLKLKELIKIARINNLHDEAKEHLQIKDIKYAKRKPLLEFLKPMYMSLTIPEKKEVEIEKTNCESDYEEFENINLNDIENIEDQENQENQEYQEYQEVQEVKNIKENKEPEIIQLDLSDLKNRKKKKQVQVVQQPQKIESPEETREREKAIVLLNNYYNRFQWLQNEIIEVPNDDPILKLKVVKAKLSSRNMSNLFAEHFFSVCYGAECVVMSTPYVSDYVKINGFTNNLRAYESTRDLLDELLIEYAPSIGDNQQLGVEARLGLVMLAVGVQTHMSNTQSIQQQPAQNIQPQIQQQKIPDINKPIESERFDIDI
jgi:hypothetical protein